MKRLVGIAILIWGLASFTYSQGTIRGKVTDENGEPLTGATVTFKALPTVGTITDYDGKYSIKLPDDSEQILLISFVSYQTIEESVKASNGEVIIRNFALTPQLTTLADVVVTAKANRAKETYMELVKTKSAISLDYISAETIKRTGDSRVDDAVKRITGVSTVGSFITVRGIGDRYIKTALNGSRIPTLDPFTNNIKLDIFPTNLVDNIVITKTSAANLPSDWSGAFLSIETKDYPEKLSISFSTTFGYNTQSTFKEVISSPHAPLEWLGLDNNFRNMEHLSKEDYPNYTNPNYYQEFIAIDALHQEGLIDYLASLGLNSSNYYASNSFGFKLGLVELDFLAPGLIDDDRAVSLATEAYNASYNIETFNYFNEPVVNFARSMPNNWETTSRTAPIDFSQEFTLGNQVTVFGRPLGFLIGLRYGSSNRYDPKSNGIPGVYQSEIPGVPAIDLNYREKYTSEVRSWSALGNLAYSISPNHNISFMFMPNIAGTNDVRFTNRYSDELESDPDLVSEIVEQQKFEERRQFIYQLRTEHFIPGPKVRMNFNASYTKGTSNSPDFKNVQYFIAQDGSLSFPQSYRPDRYFRYLYESVFDTYLNIEFPFFERPGLNRKFAFGGAYQGSNRKSQQYLYRLIGAEGSVINASVTEHFDLDLFYLDNGFLKRYYAREESPVNFGFGYLNVSSGYIMLDYSLTKSLRITGGIRAEHTDMEADIQMFYDMNLPAYDSLRIAYASFSAGGGGINVPALNAAKRKEIHYLPSINAVLKLRQDEMSPINLRMNFSKTIARPSIREVSPYYIFDFSLRAYIVGNPELVPVLINNYDLRVESYFRNGDNASISVFYKTFSNHIELIQGNYYTWKNADDSYVVGIELEGRKVLTKNLDIRANITLVQSQTRAKTTELYTDEFRPMFGQAPYVINAILGYNLERYGLSFTASYNIQGPKLIAILEAGLPNVYEIPRHLIDLKLSKSLGPHFGLSFKVRNLLNTPIQRSYKYNDWKWDYQYYTSGTDYSIGLSYNL